MRRTAAVVCVIAALVAVSGAIAQQTKPTRFVLTLDTRTNAMAFKLPNLPNMPNIPGVTDMMAPKRIISGEATYANKAVAPIWVTVPADLQLGDNQFPLMVPKTGGAGDNPAAVPDLGENAGGKIQMKTTLYWNPGTAKGPIVEEVSIDTSKMVGRGAQGAPVGDETFDIEKFAMGSESKLPKGQVGRGSYVLNTGGITIPLTGFLPAIKVTSPASVAAVKVAQGFDVKWEPVAGAKGYILHGMAMKGMGNNVSEITMWVSTTTEPPARVRHGYEQATTMDDDLAKGILLPADATECKVPAGVFKDGMDMYTFDVIAIGQDYYDSANGTVAIGKIRSTWSAMKMKAMEGMPGAEGGDEGEDAAGGGNE